MAHYQRLGLGPVRSITSRYGLKLVGKKVTSNIAKILGRNGGLKGGPKRAQVLSRTRRHDIAVQGAVARWKNAHRKIKTSNFSK